MKKGELSLKGFTLLEVLLVVACIGILAGITITAINPSKQLAKTHNAERKIDVNTILNAVYQYYIDFDKLPEDIPESDNCSDTASNEICNTGASNCGNLVDLSVLTTNEEYLSSIPTDAIGAADNGSGYNIARSPNGRITVCAPYAELDEIISVTK